MKYSVADLGTRIAPSFVSLGAQNSTHCVLVTGATGWLGQHVVDELLERGWNVVAPIRASNPQHMWERVARWKNQSNFTPIAIESLMQTHLFPKVDGVIHIAADMSLVNTLEQAWDSNVKTTQHLFEWARANGCPRFDFISTLSVFVSSDVARGRLYEDQDLFSAEHVYGGYAASKWCAEMWLQRNTLGMNLAVHRLGLLSYSSTLGWADKDGIAAWGRAWKLWGKPHWMRRTDTDLVDWTPTEYAAQGIVEAFETNSEGVHHWANTTPTPAYIWHDLFENEYGTQQGEWLKNDLGKRAVRAVGRWSQPFIHQKLWWHDVFQSDRHTYDQSRSQTVGGCVQWDTDEFKRALLTL